MFWKVFGGIVAFLMVIVLGVMMLAAVGVTAAGVAVASVVESLDINTVQVTDDSGHTETYSLSELVSESGRVEVTGDNGEQVTIDFEVPQITVQESGEDGARVVIGGESGMEIDAEGSRIHIDGRNFDNFDGHFIARPVGTFFQGLFKLALWTVVAVGIWMVLRNRQPAANEPQEKTPNATA